MGYKTVTVDVDVYVDDVIDEMDDQELIDELNSRGYTVSKDPERESFEREDWQFLLEMLDKTPETWYTRRVREKVSEARFG
jgi:6-pyruvoyl-tetrahydropterin synthase